MAKVKFLKVKGEASLVRDVSNQAIINTDGESYRAFKQRRAQMKSQQASINKLEEEKISLMARLENLEAIVLELQKKGNA
jgi:acylphosphatase